MHLESAKCFTLEFYVAQINQSSKQRNRRITRKKNVRLPFKILIKELKTVIKFIKCNMKLKFEKWNTYANCILVEG